MLPREHGSDTSRVQIRGGRLDGATGTIVDSWDEPDCCIVQVALDSGGRIDLEFQAGRRETAHAETLRTLGS